MKPVRKWPKGPGRARPFSIARSRLVRVRQRKNHTGAKRGKLTVGRYVGHVDRKDPVYECACACGRKKLIRIRLVLGGLTSSCGLCPLPTGNKSHAWRGYGELPQDIYNTIRNGASARGLKVRVSIRYLWRLFLKQDRKCAFTGWLLAFNDSHRSKKLKTASLDRINSKRGYVAGNLQWVHRDVNKLKKNMGDERFVELCVAVAKQQRKLAAQ